ncbi:MAG TPA: hypothetical protein VNA04_11020 [Thermoanaerobaculia bacterium]|nr:hypothetical protein [Thermoanaerobaculia bacterium]
MRRTLLVPFLIVMLLVAACRPAQETPEVAEAPAGPVRPADCPPPGTCPGSSCLDSITFAAATVPADACPRFGEFQGDVDIFSWNEFIALNWPADPSKCAGTDQKSIVDVRSGDGSIAVWQTYMPAERVFVDPKKSKPAAWCSGNGLTGNGMRELPHIAKASPHAARLGAHFAAIAQPGKDVLEAAGGVLTDHGLKDGKGGRWVRYERLMNLDEYRTIVDRGWWNKAGLKGQTVVLPSTPTGAVEIKSAWKVLTPAEVSGGRYFTTRATVFNTPAGAPSPGPNPVTLGLVGLHIIHKTESASNFFWSTFEHVDNDQVFFDPKSNAAPNKQTAKQPYVELNPDGTPRNPGVQVKRLHPITGPEPINAYYQQLLGQSVFRNYKLISTQWTTGGAPQGTPAWVANITLETYVQDLSVPHGQTQLTGCFACHMNAKTSIGTDGDHSFLFLEAQ